MTSGVGKKQRHQDSKYSAKERVDIGNCSDEVLQLPYCIATLKHSRWKTFAVHQLRILIIPSIGLAFLAGPWWDSVLEILEMQGKLSRFAHNHLFQCSNYKTRKCSVVKHFQLSKLCKASPLKVSSFAISTILLEQHMHISINSEM